MRAGAGPRPGPAAPAGSPRVASPRGLRSGRGRGWRAARDRRRPLAVTGHDSPPPPEVRASVAPISEIKKLSLQPGGVASQRSRRQAQGRALAGGGRVPALAAPGAAGGLSQGAPVTCPPARRGQRGGRGRDGERPRGTLPPSPGPLQGPGSRRPPRPSALTCGRGGRGAALRGGRLHGGLRRRGAGGPRSCAVWARGRAGGRAARAVRSPGGVPLSPAPRPAVLQPRRCRHRAPARPSPGRRRASAPRSYSRGRGRAGAGPREPGRRVCPRRRAPDASVPTPGPGHRPRHARAGAPR